MCFALVGKGIPFTREHTHGVDSRQSTEMKIDRKQQRLTEATALKEARWPVNPETPKLEDPRGLPESARVSCPLIW